MTSPGGSTPHPHRGRRRRRRAILAITGVVVLLVLSVAWVGFRTFQAGRALRSAEPLASRLHAELLAADATGAGRTASEMAEYTAAARRATADPLYRAATVLPWIGDDLRAVGTVATSLDDVVGTGLLPLASTAGTLDTSSLLPSDGRVDTTALRAAAPRLVSASRALDTASRRLAAIDTHGLVAPVAAPVTRVTDQMTRLDSLVRTTSHAAQVLPGMLGADGRRTWLLAFMNDAETRPGGGTLGSFALVTADHGKIVMRHQYTSERVRPAVTVDRESDDIFGPALTEWTINGTLTPDFPTTGELLRKEWKQLHHTEVDGVLAVDPVALQYLLGATGPVTLPDGARLDGRNTASELMSGVYARYEDPKKQDAVFAAAARQIFDGLLHGAGRAGGRETVSALARAAGERRLLVWTPVASETAALDGTVVQGRVTAGDGSRPEVGVFLSDVTGSKMSYYLRRTVRLTSSCPADGARRTITAHVTLRSTAPHDAARSLPRYVTGGGALGTPAGTTSTAVFLYGPAGSHEGGIDQSGSGGVTGMVNTYRGRPVVSTLVDLEPGQERTVTVRFTGVSPTGTPLARTTPLSSSGPGVTDDTSPCR